MRVWTVGLFLLAGIGLGVLGVVWASADKRPPRDTPRDQMPRAQAHLDHGPLITGPLNSGSEVTAACLVCHPSAARDVMQTSHWTWAGHKIDRPEQSEPLYVGKRNLINNFCIHAGPNMEKCASCHAGYGWADDNFDFRVETNVDCLVCHDQTNTYQKGLAGQPEKGVDLVAVAQSVGRPTRTNCGQCHFKGGGGDAVKHGDLDGTMYFPQARIDVHMGQHELQCVDCHRTQNHQIPGCGMALSHEETLRVNCTDCHRETPHGNQRLDFHTASVACQTCHIPRMAIDTATKMSWDWSTAGDGSRGEDPHVYLKSKGSFHYAQNVRPEYYWFNGRAERYLTGDKIDPRRVVQINRPLGDASDPAAKIWPFKVHRGKQVYDPVHLHLLTPRTWGPGGYWTDFDWDQACRLGAKSTGLEYSGQFDFVETEMYWPLSHMVQASEKALQCIDCHGPRGVMDWQQLGYEGDPAYRGTRHRLGLVQDEIGGSR